MKSHILKALCVTALLSPTFFQAMELQRPTEKQIDEANESVVLGTWTNLNEKNNLIVDKLKIIPLDLGRKMFVSSGKFTKDLPATKYNKLTDPKMFDADTMIDGKLIALYKVSSTPRNALLAKITYDISNKVVRASLHKEQDGINGQAISPIKLTLDNRLPKTYVHAKFLGEGLEDSSIDLNPSSYVEQTQSRIKNIDKEALRKKATPTIYIPGLFRW